MINIPNLPPKMMQMNFERRRSFAIGAKREGVRFGSKENYNNQNVITIAPGADIQKAVDTVYETGGGRVILLNGTHYMTTDLTLRDAVTLEGETLNTTIDFSGSEAGILIHGEAEALSGTIAVTNGSSSIVGTGTDWGEEMVGIFLFIDGAWNEVASVSSDTSLTLASPYSGPTQSGLSQVAGYPASFIEVRRLIVQNSAAAAVDMSYFYYCTVEDINIYDSVYGISALYGEFPIMENAGYFSCTNAMYFEQVYSGLVSGFFVGDSTNYGFYWKDGGDSTVIDFSIVNCGGNGISLENCDSVGWYSFTIQDNTGKGIEFISTSNDNQFIGGKVNRNGSDGIKLTATSDQNAIIGVTCDTNTGYGLNIAAATDDNNVVSSCVFVSNSGGQVTNSGTGTKLRGCIGNADI